MARMRPLSRSIASGALLLVAMLSTGTVAAERRHGLSAFGDLAYPPDFTHFDYAKSRARRRAATFSLVGWGGVTTFNSLNNYILKGDAAQGLELLFDSLMTAAADEPDAVYGLVAESAELAPDGKSVTFHLRPEARFSDGTKLTAEDVAFSFDTLKTKGHPIFRQTLQDVVKAEALDPQTVRYTFDGELVRDLPLTVAALPIFSKAYYTKRAVRRDDPGAAARLRALSRRQDRARPQHRLSPQPGLLGQGPAGQSRAVELRQDPLRIFPRPHRGHGGLQGRHLRFPRGVHLESLGHRIRLPGDPRGTREERGAARRDAVRHARLLPQYAARASEGPARAQGARPRLRLRVDQPQRVLRAL